MYVILRMGIKVVICSIYILVNIIDMIVELNNRVIGD